MRTVTYGAACTLDGFIAGSDGAIDWLHFSRDVENVMAQYWSTVDAVLMCRKTWQVAAAHAAVDGATSGGTGSPTWPDICFPVRYVRLRPVWSLSLPMLAAMCRGSNGSQARASV
jgi:hypothetical protein